MAVVKVNSVSLPDNDSIDITLESDEVVRHMVGNRIQQSFKTRSVVRITNTPEGVVVTIFDDGTSVVIEKYHG